MQGILDDDLAYAFGDAEGVSTSQSLADEYRSQLVILDKDNQIVPFKPNYAQSKYIQERTGRDLILKARQLGMSTVIQAEHFVSAISTTSMAATLAHDDSTTQKLRRMARRFYDGLDKATRPPRGLDNATTTTYPQTGSEVTIATAGSIAVGRGGTYSHVHGSEVAFWKDAESLMAGILQGVPRNGQIVLESTPNGAQGWFYERCMEALDGNSAWKLHFLAWWLDEGYALPLERGETLAPYADDEASLIAKYRLMPEQIKWRRSKQRELGRLFAQEYPEDPHSCFLASGIGYFSDITDLERVFTAPSNPVYNANHRYVAAFDFGQANDYSAISVVDATTLEEVELWRQNRISWSDIRSRALQIAQKWHLQSLHPERNSMGGTNIEELNKEFYAAKCKTQIVPFDTTPQTKPLMVTAFHWAIDQGGLKLLPDPIGKQEIRAYAAKQTPSGAWQYEGLPHDDTVIARVGVWHAIAAPKATLSFSSGKYA